MKRSSMDAFIAFEPWQRLALIKLVEVVNTDENASPQAKKIAAQLSKAFTAKEPKGKGKSQRKRRSKQTERSKRY